MENLPTYPTSHSCHSQKFVRRSASGGLLYLWGYGAYGQLGFGFDDLRFRRARELASGACKAWLGVPWCTIGFIHAIFA